MGGWLNLTAGAGGLVGVGSGWTNTTAWLAAGAVVAALALIAWWITGLCRGRRRGRREELALRRYDLRGHPRSGRSNRPGDRAAGGATLAVLRARTDDTIHETKEY